MKPETAYDRLADFFGLPLRWRDLSATNRKRFLAVWKEIHS